MAFTVVSYAEMTRSNGCPMVNLQRHRGKSTNKATSQAERANWALIWIHELYDEFSRAHQSDQLPGYINIDQREHNITAGRDGEGKGTGILDE